MEDLYLRQKVLDNNFNFWQKLDNEQYDALFEGSAIRRAKSDKFKMNTAVAGNLKQ